MNFPYYLSQRRAESQLFSGGKKDSLVRGLIIPVLTVYLHGLRCLENAAPRVSDKKAWIHCAQWRIIRVRFNLTEPYPPKGNIVCPTSHCVGPPIKPPNSSLRLLSPSFFFATHPLHTRSAPPFIICTFTKTSPLTFIVRNALLQIHRYCSSQRHRCHS